jgi:ribosomally synthesized peptide (two-chain TOMM family)
MSNGSLLSAAQEFGTVWPQCVARAWEDPQFREALKSDPARTLLESYQFTIPAGVALQVFETSDAVPQAPQDNVLRMVIPPAPEMDVQKVAKGNAESYPDMRAAITIC